MKVYGSDICKDCVAADIAMKAAGIEIQHIDITENTKNLKEFLALRDSRSEFAEVRARGGIGIPCFVFDDGTITFDIPGITSRSSCESCR